MKRMIAFIGAALVAVIALTACSNKDANKMKNDAAVIASEAKDNIDNMIQNGTVKDGDGYIEEEKHTDSTISVIESRGAAEESADIADENSIIADETDAVDDNGDALI